MNSKMKKAVATVSMAETAVLSVNQQQETAVSHG